MDKLQQLWQQDKDHFIHPYTDFASFHQEGSQIISKASGNYVYDGKGQQLLDGIAGLWCVNIGHGREEMADVIRDQVLKMQYYNPFGHSTNEPAAELANKLAELAPGSLNHVFYTTGGSCANDIALRLAHYYQNLRGKPNKKKIISRNNGYHGSTYFSANLTGIHGTKFGFDRICDELISHVSAADCYNRPVGTEEMSDDEYASYLVNELENRIIQLGPDNVCAFIAEPIMGAGGVLVAPEGYHKRCWEVCKKYDVLYIADEVVTAFGRLGEWFASDSLFNYQPDIVVVAKGINSGYVPLGAAIFSEEIYQVISQPQCEGWALTLGFTYSGHATACAAALKNLEILERENILGNVKTLGPKFHNMAASMTDLPLVGDVRGEGYMMGIQLVDDKQKKTPANVAHDVFTKCLEKGVVVRPIVDKIVLSPPLTLNETELTTLVGAVHDSIAEVGAGK